ncbi:MAG: filamentous hemagglutinin N-terminal domain-containing protein, partial [Maritimibacter sp.]
MIKVQEFLRRVVAFTSSAAVALQIVVQPLYAQSVVTDGGANGATVLITANGTPMVMVNTPNTQGLSHNTFDRFDVGTEGLILNNADQNYVLTNLAGYVQGNSAVSGGSASVILNEVTGTNASDLNGYMEVAGNTADVIVANAYGITCNGCGFINTDHVALTTGAPSISAGVLTGFSVEDGTIAIGELGADATGVSQFDLIARKVSFGGAVQGQNVRVVAGRNDVLYATGEATAKAADGSTAPDLAIDSTALGGMYANSITINSTEAGSGVRAPQTMSASAGGMHITADGRLVFGRAASTGNVTATADDIQVETFVKTDNALTIDAAGQLVLDTGAVVVAGTDALLSAQDMELGADAAVMGGNFLQIATAGLLDAGTGSNMLSYGDVTVTAGQFAAGMGALAYAGLTDGEGTAAVADLHFDITGDASFSGATMLATGNAQFDASQITIDATPLIEPSAFTGGTGLTFNGTGLSVGEGVALHSGADLGINLSGTMTLGDEAELMATDSISIGAGDATLSGAVLQAGSAIDLTARGTAVLDGNFLTSGVLSVSAETLTQSAGTMTGLLGVDLSATAGAMSLSGTVQSDAGIDLAATGDLTQTATGLLLSTGGNLSLTADGAAELNGSLKAAGNITLQGKTATLAGDVLAGLTLDAQTTGGTLTQSGSIEAGAVKLTASAGLSNSGTVIGIADLQAGGNFSNSGTVEGDALSVTAADFANTGTGVLRANNTLVFTLTGSFDNAGDLEAGTGIQVTAADELTNSGSIESTGVVILTGSDLSNTVSGQIEADSITVDLSGALVSAGTIGAVQDVLLTAGSVNNSGSIIAQAASQVETATLRNSGTISVKGGGLWLTGLAQFNNTSGTILSDTGISIATSQALTIGASGWGSVSTDGWMTLAGLNGGVLPSLTVSSGAELVAGGDLTIIAGAVTNAGTLASVNGNLVITSTAGISNSGLVYAGGNWLLLRANGTITNDGGTLLALNNLGICGNSTDDCLAVFGTDRAAALTNKNGGQIEAITGDVLIAADVINNGLASDVSVTEVAPVEVSSTQVGSMPSCGLNLCNQTYTYYIEKLSRGSISATRNVAASLIVAGGNISFDAATISNAYSLISARGDISLSAGSVANLGVKTGITDITERHHYKWVDFPWPKSNETVDLGSDDPIVTFTQTGQIAGTIEAGGAITGTIPGALSNGVLTANQTNFSANSASEPGLSTLTFTLLSIAAAGVSDAAQPGGAGGLTFNADTITNPTLASLGLSDIAGLSNDQLFTVNADPVSGYLIETKPDFIDLNSFLGSEYFTDSLGFDPEGTQLRLGDALVETYLIRNQLYNLTGRNILDPTLSEKAQMKAMYDNAINAYESLDLRPGISLSPDQVALLTDDIIWPEEHLINGVKVLVPHVYLASATIDRFSNGAGAQIAGTRIALNTGNILNQGGSIRAEEDLILFASADIDNLFGEISAGNRLSMAADGGFTSLSGLISGKDVGIQAANINIATALTDIGTGGDRIDIAGRQSTVRASNNLSLSADNDLSIIGTRMVAGNNLALQAGGDITVGALHLDRQQSATMEGSSFEMSQRQILASSLTAENGSLSITSARFDEEGQLTGGGNVFLEATALSAGDDISIAAAAGDVMLGAGLETRATSSFSQSSGFLGSSSRTSQTFDANYQSTTLDAGGDVSVYGAGNVISQGAQIAAGGDVAMQAGYGSLVFDSMTDLHVAYEHHDSSILGGFMDFTGTKETVRATAHDGAVTAGGDIALIAGGDLVIEGGSFTAGGAFATDVGGKTWLSASVDTEYSSTVSHNNNALLVTDTTDVRVSQEAHFTKINAEGGKSFDPDSAITVGLVGDQAALGTMARDLIGITDPEDQGQRLALLDYYTPDPTAPPSLESETTPPTDPLIAALTGISEKLSENAGEPSVAPEVSTGLMGKLFPQEEEVSPYDYSQSLVEVGLPGADIDAGYAYLDDLDQSGRLSVEDMQLVQHAFHDQHQELGVVSKLVLNYVVGTITGGIGNAALQAAASSAITGVVNGAVSGDLDLGQIAFSAITAGVTAGLTSSFNLGNELGLSSDGLLREGGQLSLNSIANGFGDAVITSGINSVVYGSDFGTGVLQNFGHSVVSLATADFQTEIG